MNRFYKAISSSILLLFTPLAGAQIWTNSASPLTNWLCVAMSADASKMVAIAVNNTLPPKGGIFVSTNYGANWTQTSAPSTNWFTVCSSADGTHLAVCTGGQNLIGPIFLSTNSGSTWKVCSAPLTNWWDVAISPDGSKLVANAAGPNGVGPVFYSTNYGSNWSQASAPALNWSFAACSADGMNWVSTTWGQQIYRSTNYGANWSLLPASPSANWTAIASSTDGVRLIASIYNGFIYRSTNSGTTWQSVAFSGDWVGVAGSTDLTRLIAAESPGSIYTSTNFGTSWQPVPDPSLSLSWQFLGSSADGGKFVAAPFGGARILRGVSTINPQMDISSTGTSAQISWVTPSQPFRLTQKTNLPNGAWVNVTNQAFLNFSNLHYEVAIPASGSKFFRLESP